MMIYLSGLLTGILLGYIIKRSRFCLTGLVRDIYLERRGRNALYILAILSAEGFCYHLLRCLGLIHTAAYLAPFSLLSVAVGSFLFGFGAVLAGGCLTSTLIKCGDGRLTGWGILASFFAVAWLVSAGPLLSLSKAARRIAVVSDELPGRDTLLPVIVFAAAGGLLFLYLYRTQKTRRSLLPGRYHGLRHILFEKRWSMEFLCAILGLFLGLVFLISHLSGRPYGVAIASPLMSFVYAITRPVEICGGCNSYDQVIGWGSMLVLGIMAGSFLTAKLSGEFTPIRAPKGTLPRALAGGALMGIGSMWGLGCLLSNGLVGAAQLSLKSWYAAFFLAAGIWCAAAIRYRSNTP